MEELTHEDGDLFGKDEEQDPDAQQNPTDDVSPEGEDNPNGDEAAEDGGEDAQEDIVGPKKFKHQTLKEYMVHQFNNLETTMQAHQEAHAKFLKTTQTRFIHLDKTLTDDIKENLTELKLQTDNLEQI